MMAKIKVNIDDEIGKTWIDASYEDLDDLVATVSNLVTCLIYTGLHNWKITSDEEAEKIIEPTTNVICRLIAKCASLDKYKEFCECFAMSEEENNLYNFMEEVYEDWLISTSKTEKELISLCKKEPLDLKIQKNNNGNIEILLVNKNDEQVIENLKSINTRVGDEILDNVAEKVATQIVITLVILGDRTFEDEQDNYFRKLDIDEVKERILDLR